MIPSPVPSVRFGWSSAGPLREAINQAGVDPASGGAGAGYQQSRIDTETPQAAQFTHIDSRPWGHREDELNLGHDIAT